MVAGRLRFYSKNWSKYTTNKEILQTVQGMKIEFHAKLCQLYIPTELRLNAKESTGISNEIHRLVNLGVVVPSENETSQFVSTVFARPKKDSKYRTILNLSKLNEYVTYHHFKMDTLETALKFVTPCCFMASIDLRDAYYCVPIHSDDQKYLKFTWQGKLYQYTALPNGLTSGPRNSQSY